MKTFLTLFASLLLVISISARPVAIWPYDKLTEEADVIIIATPTSSRDTSEKTTFPGQSSVAAVGVETTFDILSVLKGEKGLKTIVFHHLRAEKPNEEMPDGPSPVAFKLEEKKRFLLFLKLEPDGRLSSLTGQTDPKGGIKDLGTHP